MRGRLQALSASHKYVSIASYSLRVSNISLLWVKPVSAEALMRNVGRRVAELREARDVTQQQLADSLDVTMRYVQSIEGGEQNLTLRSLANLAAVLRAPVAALFDPPATRSKQPGRPKRRSQR